MGKLKLLFLLTNIMQNQLKLTCTKLRIFFRCNYEAIASTVKKINKKKQSIARWQHSRHHIGSGLENDLLWQHTPFRQGSNQIMGFVRMLHWRAASIKVSGRDFKRLSPTHLKCWKPHMPLSRHCSQDPFYFLSKYVGIVLNRIEINMGI